MLAVILATVTIPAHALFLRPATEATLVADYWGPDRYAVRNGVFNAPLLAAGAIAPAAGADIAAAAGSYPALFSVLAAVAVIGAALAVTAPAPGTRGQGASGSVREPGGEQRNTAP